MATLRYKSVSNATLGNLRLAATALEHLRTNYFPWGAGNQAEPNKNTDGVIRLRTWAIRNPSSPFYRYGGWQTADPDTERNAEVRNVKACARQRETVFLGKGGNCQEHGDTTFDYVRTIPFTGNYQYIHRLTWDGGHHEYTVIGAQQSQNKTQMNDYILVDPWVTSPQVCLFKHSCWHGSYRNSRDHRFTINSGQANLQAILSVDENSHYAVSQRRNRQRLLWDAMEAAKQDYHQVKPLTWMCLNCKTHVNTRQVTSNTSLCHNCGCDIRSQQEQRTILALFKTDPDRYVRNPDQFRRDYRRQHRPRNRRIPKAMPLLEDPSNAFDVVREEIRTPREFRGRTIMERTGWRTISSTPKVFKKKRRGYLFDRQSRIKTVQLDVPKTREMSIKWGDEWWTHPYCTKDNIRYIYYDNRAADVPAAKAAAKLDLKTHIDDCRISATYNA